MTQTPLFCFMVQSSRAIFKECGCNDDHLPALTTAVIILGMPRLHILSSVCFSFSAKPKITVSFIIPLPGITPSIASHCWQHSILLTLSGRTKEVNVVSPNTLLYEPEQNTLQWQLSPFTLSMLLQKGDFNGGLDIIYTLTFSTRTEQYIQWQDFHSLLNQHFRKWWLQKGP